MIDEAGERIGWLCVRLAQPDGPLAKPGPMRDLATRIAGRLRGGRAPGDLDDDLDELEDLLLLAGYTGGLSGNRAVYLPLPGVSGHPVLEVLACPAETCHRVEAPSAGEDPVCAVAGKPLRRVRLRS